MSDDITLDDQVAELARELALRERVYARQVSDHVLTQERADRQIGRLRSALATLRGVQRLAPQVADVLPILGTSEPPFQLRRSGRTTRLIQGLPDGAIFIVFHVAMVREADRLVQKAGKRDVLVVSVEDLGKATFHQFIAGRMISAVVLDHDVRDMGLIPDEAMHVLELIERVQR